MNDPHCTGLIDESMLVVRRTSYHRLLESDDIPMMTVHRHLVVVHTLLSTGPKLHEAHHMNQVNVGLTRTTRHRCPVIVYIILQSEDVPLIAHRCLVVPRTPACAASWGSSMCTSSVVTAFCHSHGAQARPSHASPACNVAQALSSSRKRVLTKRVADCRRQSGVTVSVHTILGR